MNAVRLLTPGDLDTVAATLSRAFADDPVWAYVLPRMEPDERAVAMRRFFRTEARQRARRATVWTTPGGEAATIWAEPGRWRTSIRDGLALAAALVRAGGPAVLGRMAGFTAIRKAHPDQPHWYLESLGTDPPLQGRGLGTALLEPVLARCDTEGTPAYLESAKESNIPYYERFGFRVTSPIVLPKGGPTLHAMWREPA